MKSLTKEQVEVLMEASEALESVGNPGEWGRFQARLRRLLESFMEKSYKCPKCGERLQLFGIDGMKCISCDTTFDRSISAFLPNWACYKDDWNKGIQE